MAPRPLLLLLLAATVALVWALLIDPTAATDSQQCPQARLLHTDMESLGVHHVHLLGEVEGAGMFMRAFVRLKKSPSGRLRLFGLAWLEYTKYLAGYQPELREIQERFMANMSLVGMNPNWKDAGFSVPLRATHTWNKKEHVKNFRMDVDVQLPAKFHHLHAFQVRMHGWDRYFSLEVHRHAAHGLILPWHAMESPPPSAFDTRHHSRKVAQETTVSGQPARRELGPAASASAAEPPAASSAAAPTTAASPPAAAGEEATHSGPSPLVVAIALGSAVSDDLDVNRLTHQAQALIRHAEYHLGQLKMQRVLVYTYPFIFNSPAFHDYLSRHMPPDLLPYVTFVMWTQLPIHQYSWVWQVPMYYHAAVALWDHGGVRVANIDLDEYIAFPAPHVTLQEALEGCGAQEMDVVELLNEFVVCPACMDLYGPNNYADGTLWAQVETPLASSMWEPHRQHPEGQDKRAQQQKQEKQKQQQRAGKGLQRKDGQPGKDKAGAAAGSGGGGAVEGSSSSSWPCRWWATDPLLMYGRRWNDRWFQQNKLKRSDRMKEKVIDGNRGKVLVRPEGLVAFNWHHADALDKKKQVILDSDRCPFVAHLMHLFGARVSQHGGAKTLYQDPEVAVQWWLIQEGAQQQQQQRRRR